MHRKYLKDIIVFLKAQVSSLLGGIVDYVTMVFFTEVFNIHYTISIGIGGIVGAVVNFLINKNWTFKSGRRYLNTSFSQLLKFVIVVLNSILLKASGTYFITNYLSLDYKISRIIIDLIVSLGFNFTLQKKWVFKKVKK